MKNTKRIINLLLILSLTILLSACNKQSNIDEIVDNESEIEIENENDIDNEEEYGDSPYNEVLTEKIKWAADLYDSDYDRNFLKMFTQAFTKVAEDNNADEIAVIDFETIPTGTCSNDECIEMFKTRYVMFKDDLDEEEYLYIIIYSKPNDKVETEYTLLDYMTLEEIINKYETGEYLSKYDDKFQAACMEIKNNLIK